MPCLLKTQKTELNIMLLNVTITFVGYNNSDEVRVKCTQNKKQTPAKSICYYKSSKY
jgi:hypothetical protein